MQAQAAAELQTTSASVGTTVNSQALLALPNLGRDAATLTILQPGITPGGSTAGAVNDQNTYLIDGGNNSDDMSGGTTSYTTNFTGLGGAQTNASTAGAVPVPVESVEEFKVTTFNQTADFNGGLGSQVQMVTKRGTNQFHGSGYEYYFATNVGAGNSWANDHTCTPLSPNCQSISTNPGVTGNFPTPGYANPLPSNHRNRFGASLGGFFTPNLLGGKWYFFFNYEGQRFPNNNVYERPVPAPARQPPVPTGRRGARPGRRPPDRKDRPSSVPRTVRSRARRSRPDTCDYERLQLPLMTAERPFIFLARPSQARISFYKQKPYSTQL